MDIFFFKSLCRPNYRVFSYLRAWIFYDFHWFSTCYGYIQGSRGSRWHLGTPGPHVSILCRDPRTPCFNQGLLYHHCIYIFTMAKLFLILLKTKESKIKMHISTHTLALCIYLSSLEHFLTLHYNQTDTYYGVYFFYPSWRNIFEKRNNVHQNGKWKINFIVQ